MDPPPTLLTSLLSSQTATCFKRTSEDSSTTASHITTSTLTPMSSLKRTSPRSPGCQHPATSGVDSDTTTAFKRRRLSPTNLSISTDIARNSDLLTPPLSPPPELAARTMRLKLEIPRPEISKEEQTKLKMRQSYARRWIPKLQRPFPKNTEIKEAYQYKLMRHYTDPLAPAISDFIKPRIDRSPRVESLLKRFPILPNSGASSSAAYATTAKTSRAHKGDGSNEVTNNRELQQNMSITSSVSAQKLAWEAFSSREQDIIDRGREAMMQSGLWTDDLARENVGMANELPEWRKTRTGRFARSARAGAHAGDQHAAMTSAPRC
jgi:hypothetical protein